MAEASTENLLKAGGLVSLKSKADKNATERIVARKYPHPALGDRPVIRLASDRLGPAEDLAMEFLGFGAPKVSKPLAIQHRRSLSFASWALINDPDNAHFALDLVKQMKSAARKARSKPGHAWDQYVAVADDLGLSAPHFLPLYWEDAGRAYKDLGNQTYAGRSLSRSLKAERVHALESDRERRRDVVLEFALAGCIAGKALSEYSKDLQEQYEPEEAFRVFRELCSRRTRGGMAPWATMPKDFARIAKTTKLDADAELETWLEEIVDAPAMARTSIQFWKSCSKHCTRLVKRSPDFAVSLLRLNRQGDYGDSSLWPWLDLLESWGGLEYAWKDEHNGATPLGEPIAEWFGRIAREACPAPTRVLSMLQSLVPRLKSENRPLPLFEKGRWGGNQVDVDVLEACFVLGVAVNDPVTGSSIDFYGWLAEDNEHELRNQDIVHSIEDERFTEIIVAAFPNAVECRIAERSLGWNRPSIAMRPFPEAAGERPGILKLWRNHSTDVIGRLEGCGLVGFQEAREALERALWPETLKLFPELKERITAVDPVLTVQLTLQCGVFDEYGWPHLEEFAASNDLKIKLRRYGKSNLYPCFPHLIVSQGGYLYVLHSDGTTEKTELRLPKNTDLENVTIVDKDLAVTFREKKTYESKFYWASNPSQLFEASCYNNGIATVLPDGGVFFGVSAVRPGDKKFEAADYFHDGDRFWRLEYDHDNGFDGEPYQVVEHDPQTGKKLRASVPPWFEGNEGGKVQFNDSSLLLAPSGLEQSPLGIQDGKLGFKAIRRRDDTAIAIRIDGRRWEKRLGQHPGRCPTALLNQVGTDQLIPVTHDHDSFNLWDPDGKSIVTHIDHDEARKSSSQVAILPNEFWHLLKPRHIASSKILRSIDRDTCARLIEAASTDLTQSKREKDEEKKMPQLLSAMETLLPDAPRSMQIGLANVVLESAHQINKFIELRDRTLAGPKPGQSPSDAVQARIDQGAGSWNLPYLSFQAMGGVSISQNITEAMDFFRGNSDGGILTTTRSLWYPLIEINLGDCWRAYWTAVETGDAKPSTRWLDFLAFWQSVDLASLPGQFAFLRCKKLNKKNLEFIEQFTEETRKASFSIVNGEDRFVAFYCAGWNEAEMVFVRYSTAKKPQAPPDFKVSDTRTLKRPASKEAIDEFIAAATERGTSMDSLPLPTKEELANLAERLNLSPAEVGLIWISGMKLDSYHHNFLPTEIRSAMGIKVNDANAARQSFRNINDDDLKSLFASVIEPGGAAPFAEDRTPCLQAIEKEWQANMPSRLTIDAALQRRLAALGNLSRWSRGDDEVLLTAAAEPEDHPILQPIASDIVLKKDRWSSLELVTSKPKSREPIQVGLIASALRLISMISTDTPMDHVARKAMPRLYAQLKKMVGDPAVLLTLRHVHLYDDGNKKLPTPAEWINRGLGKATVNKDLCRFEDSLVLAVGDTKHSVLIAYRPAALVDRTARNRLRALCDVETNHHFYLAHVAPIDVLQSSGIEKLCQKIGGGDGSATDRWPQNPIHTVPKLVSAVSKKLSIEETSAQLYLQLLALPEPTSANLKKWNDWTAAKLKNATKPLVDRKLVIEAKRARASRNVFLPGGWTELKSPWLPLETWKASLFTEIDADLPNPFPLGGPMILRPVDDLFQAAWQRVLDGDEPAYEEIKRKGKSKSANKATKSKKSKSKKEKVADKKSPGKKAVGKAAKKTTTKAKATPKKKPLTKKTSATKKAAKKAKKKASAKKTKKKTNVKKNPARAKKSVAKSPRKKSKKKK